MLTEKQYFAIGVNAVTARLLLTYPHILVQTGGNAAWISVLCSTLYALLLFGAVYFFYSGKYNVIELAERLGGKYLRIAVGIMTFVVIFLSLLPTVYGFPKLIRLVLLQGTHVEYIGLAFIAAIILGALCGISSLGRVHEIFMPIAAIFAIGFFILLIPSVDLNNIMPIFGKGMGAVFVDGASGISLFSDLLLLNLLLPHVKQLDTYKRVGIKTIAVGGSFSVLMLLAYGLCYTYPTSVQFFFPVYQLERLIHLSNFFSRFEAVFQFIWSIQILLYSSVSIAVLSKTWQLTFGLADNGPLVMPCAVLLAGAALVPKGMAEFNGFETGISKWLFIPAFLLPIILGSIRRRGDKNVSRETI